MEQQENIKTNSNLTLQEKFKFFFTSPSKLFEHYRENPKYGILFLITALSTIFYKLVYSNFSKEIIKENMERQLEGADPQALELSKRIVDISSKPIINAFSSFIGVLISVFVSAFIIFIIFKISKVALNYKQTITLSLIAGLPNCIGSIIKVIYMLISKKAIGINAALNPSIKNTLISTFDIFTLWQYILLGIGIYAMGKASKKKAIILTIILAILSIGFTVLIASLTMNK
ncbi:YIP1 family protein [Clostridium sporogenes]|uniref:YIP1 family protein n=1 Tax=Clostridium sporogenes TaxID=1509 RepID=UPI0013D48A4E|nr:YIP1 family protein [Clostridium sporogenes]EJP6471593.1 YIP1 family protein [Clostridium botulinum]NFV12356.1 YIP1 family protein [Clostridium sporogenes]